MANVLTVSPVTPNTLSEAAAFDFSTGGLFPPFYPGPQTFPGWAQHYIGVSAVSARAALFPPFYPGPSSFPGRGSILTETAA